MKIYLTIFLSALFIPFVAFGAYDDVSMSGSAVITVGGYDLVVSGTASFDSITVSSGSFSVNLSNLAELIVTSSDKRSFVVSSAGGYRQSFTCGSSVSTLTLNGNVTDATVTVTVTPSSDACSTAGGGVVSSSGGGGGGYSAPAVSTQTTVDVEPATAKEETAGEVISAPSVVSAVSVSPIFVSVMSKGMSNSDIKRLQQLLNSDPDTQIAVSGVGSPGNETEYFGSLTSAAVKKFQVKYDIVSSGDESTTGYGLVGPATRAKLQEVFAKAEPTAPEVAQPSAAAVSVSPVFNSGLDKGMSNSSVKRLQQLLNSDPDTRIAESGVGSSGNETNYFGTLTLKAVQKFQMKYKVVSSASDPGYGYVGPKTRAKLAEVFSETATTAEPATTEEPAEEQAGAEVENLEAQLQTMLQQLEALQVQLKAMQ